jgi:hypothetical protein
MALMAVTSACATPAPAAAPTVDSAALGTHIVKSILQQLTPAALPAALPSPTSGVLAVGTEMPTVAPVQASPTSATRPAPGDWQEMPVIPAVSENARQIYLQGLDQGNDPHAFSKVGDCEARTTWFLSDFDHGPKAYSLGDYGELQGVIDNFKGSYERLSLAAKPGFTAASLLSPIWADPQYCKSGETPLDCEYRVHNPSYALIMLGTNDVPHMNNFESNMRDIVEDTITAGVVPILVTKADNLEGDNKINKIIASLAVEYDVPLLNFWRAVQDLPDQGLQSDGAHLTFGTNHFDNAQAMKSAWTMRNLTALQALDAAWRGVANP